MLFLRIFPFLWLASLGCRAHPAPKHPLDGLFFDLLLYARRKYAKHRAVCPKRDGAMGAVAGMVHKQILSHDEFAPFQHVEAGGVGRDAAPTEVVVRRRGGIGGANGGDARHIVASECDVGGESVGADGETGE